MHVLTRFEQSEGFWTQIRIIYQNEFILAMKIKKPMLAPSGWQFCKSKKTYLGMMSATSSASNSKTKLRMDWNELNAQCSRAYLSRGNIYSYKYEYIVAQVMESV